MQSEDSRIQIVQANCLFKVMGQELVNMTEPRKQQSIYVSAFISIQFSIKFRTFITTAGIRTAFDQTWAHVTHFSIQYRHLFQFKMVTIREWTWPRGFLTTFGKIQVNEKKNQRLWVFRILDAAPTGSISSSVQTPPTPRPPPTEKTQNAQTLRCLKTRATTKYWKRL